MAHMKGPSTVDRLKDMPRPLNIKSHLYARFFKRYLDQPEICPKFVVVMRNVKDVIVSFYHFQSYIPVAGFKGRTFDEFFEKFKDKTIHLGDPIDHMIGWWKYKDHPNVHIVFYEDMLRDTLEHIKAIGSFIDCPVSDETACRIKDGCSITKMRERDLGMYFAAEFYKEATFFRKGGSGDWKNHMSEEQVKFVDDLVKEKCHPLGLFIWWQLARFSTVDTPVFACFIFNRKSTNPSMNRLAYCGICEIGLLRFKMREANLIWVIKVLISCRLCAARLISFNVDFVFTVSKMYFIGTQ